MNISTNNAKSRNRDTRWDRIRKKHINNINVKTETVKKFIEMDFIGKNQMNLMNGNCENKICLDPAIVMDLRHEVFTRITKKTNCVSIKSFVDEKRFYLENAKNQNKFIDEDRQIENELKKFKAELKRQRPNKTTIINRPKLCTNLNNKELLSSLTNCKSHIENFYTTTTDAFQKLIKASETSSEDCSNPNEKLENDTKIPLENSKKLSESPQNDRCVRFEDSIEIISYSKEESIYSNRVTDADNIESRSRTSEFIEEVLADNQEQTNNQLQKLIDEKIDEEIYENVPKTLNRKINKVKNSNIESAHQNQIISKNHQNKSDKTSVSCLLDDEILKITKIQQEKLNIPDSSITKDESDDSDKSSEIGSDGVSTDLKKEQNAIIAELFRPKFPEEEIILRKYLLKWIHYVTIEKMEKQNFSYKHRDQIQKINAFLDNIKREKARIAATKQIVGGENDRQKMVTLTKKYQNKIKIQQDIIELQKIKLQRQERAIMELKLSKLSEDTIKARYDIKNELKSVIRNGDHKKRSKAKCLQLVGNLRDEEDEEFEKLQGRKLITPKFLARMQERALQRSIKHEQARQRRLQLEAEREAAKLAADEARRLEDEEAKRRRIQALKDKLHQEKMTKIIKERERQKCIENNRKAQDFCRRRILNRFGMEAFRRLFRIRKLNQRKAILHRKRVLKMKIFFSWKSYYQKIWDNKKQLADNLHVKLLKCTMFKSWTVYISIQRSKYYVAVDWYELKISEYLFKCWYDLMKIEKVIEGIKTRQALAHYQWHLKWKVVERWSRLPQILKLEKETEERRQKWRMKIWELLPDYMPNRDHENN